MGAEAEKAEVKAIRRREMEVMKSFGVNGYGDAM